MIKSSGLRQVDVCSKRKTNVYNKPLWLRIWNEIWNSFNIFTWQTYEFQFEQHKIPLIFLHTDVRHLLPPRLPQADVNGLNCFLFLGLRLILSSHPFSFARLGSVITQLSVILCKLHNYPWGSKRVEPLQKHLLWQQDCLTLVFAIC